MSSEKQTTESRVLRQPSQSPTSSDIFLRWRFLLASAWVCHFAASIAIVLWGRLRYDDDRKYIPIDPKTVGDECSKAYANVLASSITEIGTIVCCSNENTEGICASVPGYLIFARRLARMPDAWLLPLFPLLVRGVVRLAERLQRKQQQQQQQQRGSNAANDDGTASKRQKEIDALTIRRFFLYFGLIQFRGFVLYLLLDKIEGAIVEPAGDSCWYDDLLRSHHNPCHGKPTDYSDHMVLFYSQILPIPLLEVLSSFVAPFWTNHGVLRKTVPTMLVSGLLYLYLISFLATYKTVAYFHTVFEVGIGYLISLLVQVPLCLIQCTSLMKPIRDYFFGRGEYAKQS
eukprot:CAMPEP_0201184422 /NCGR_PEP_ID=MMETSP0851-20130426/126110_1 /ASSEMBLY_ACC=CAM_ASM_000631 /TAXON_ID=183588 /ORGANISM="Pseudo-nitzschia fraudulenta, Strain WWA7" /LENGTH=343 /DNA_ID=CAMNT_0047469389 /DNA_START=71 /DNA_END=1102 /DNA_ORIENTATION=+